MCDPSFINGTWVVFIQFTCAYVCVFWFVYVHSQKLRISMSEKPIDLSYFGPFYEIMIFITYICNILAFYISSDWMVEDGSGEIGNRGWMCIHHPPTPRYRILENWTMDGLQYKLHITWNNLVCLYT